LFSVHLVPHAKALVRVLLPMWVCRSANELLTADIQQNTNRTRTVMKDALANAVADLPNCASPNPVGAVNSVVRRWPGEMREFRLLRVPTNWIGCFVG